MNDGLDEYLVNPSVGLAGTYCESWIDSEQFDKPNCKLAWLSNPNKPSGVMASLSRLIKPSVTLIAWSLL